MVVCIILLYVVICCMFTMSLRCVFISLCGDAFVYESAILAFVLGARNLCGSFPLMCMALSFICVGLGMSVMG